MVIANGIIKADASLGDYICLAHGCSAWNILEVIQ